MKRAIWLLVLLILASGAQGQELPPYEDNGRALADKLRSDKPLAALMRINSVEFDYSEQKVIEGQAHRIAHYNINVTILAPACVMNRVGGSWTFTSVARNCEHGFPQMPSGHSGTYSVIAVWKQTDQGWRFVRGTTVSRWTSG